jgi:hypothetical protein
METTAVAAYLPNFPALPVQIPNFDWQLSPFQDSSSFDLDFSSLMGHVDRVQSTVAASPRGSDNGLIDFMNEATAFSESAQWIGTGLDVSAGHVSTLESTTNTEWDHPTSLTDDDTSSTDQGYQTAHAPPDNSLKGQMGLSRSPRISDEVDLNGHGPWLKFPPSMQSMCSLEDYRQARSRPLIELRVIAPRLQKRDSTGTEWERELYPGFEMKGEDQFCRVMANVINLSIMGKWKGKSKVQVVSVSTVLYIHSHMVDKVQKCYIRIYQLVTRFSNQFEELARCEIPGVDYLQVS